MMSNSYKNWKVIAGIATSAVLLTVVLSSNLLAPKVEGGGGIDDSNKCLTTDGTNGLAVGFVQHWDKIVFKVLRDPSGKITPSLLGVALDVKFPEVVGNEEGIVNLDDVVRQTLTNQFGLDSQQKAALRILIVDVEYAIACQKGIESNLFD